MIGQLEKVEGVQLINGVVAYVGQNPFVMNDSIKNNITFGLPFSRKKFRNSLEVCSFDEDIEKMENRELSVVG